MTLQHDRMPASAGASSTGFADLGVRHEIAAALTAQGIDAPFPIQAATLPDSLSGRDVLGRGRTGSGKTIAFAVPTLSALAASGRRRQKGSPRALILVPTRELAAQVAAAIVPLSDSLGLRSMTVYGGVSQGPQVSKLAAGVDVCIATPGRLEDLIGQGRCRLADVEVTVLDEADHMADLGFLPAVKRLLDQTPRDGQRLLFSATLDNGIDQIVRRYLHDPITHSVDSETSHVPDMEHHAFVVEQRHKADVVRRLVSGRGRTLAFTRTKHGAKALARKLTAAGVPAVDLHGNLSQGARQRNLEAFGSGRVRVLVATDIAARGIHVDDVGLVVHVDPPSEHKAYLHRSGRTARAGAKGRVVTVMTHEQRRDVRQLMRRASIKPVIADVAPDSGKIVELTGPLAERVDPAEAALRTAAAPSANGSNRNRNQNRSSSNNRNRGGNRRRGNRSRR